MTDPILTLNRTKPLDFPEKTRPFRIYAALTNACNRACPWCSACASPQGRTFLTLSALKKHIPETGTFEVQLEGGEPFLHPDFWYFVRFCVDHRRCKKIVVVTNGTTLPRDETKLEKWLDRFGDAFTLKLSINHYLLERDTGLIDLAKLLQEVISRSDGNKALVLNVRLRKNTPEDVETIQKRIEDSGLTPHANIFYLQRYGYAENEDSWDEPYIIEDNFILLNPDGKSFKTDMVERSKAMRKLP
jgi:MoaA/NifB/PqqE/SkfB family radical SAM enzyme